jgi:hypothetical protein
LGGIKTAQIINFVIDKLLKLKIMKLKLFFIIALFYVSCMSGTIGAVETSEVNYLLVWSQDESVLGYYGLEENPVVTYDNGYLNVSTENKGIVAEFVSSQVMKFTLGDNEDIATQLKEQLLNSSYLKKDGNVLVFSSFKSGSSVMVVSLDGKVMTSETIDSEGNLVLPISHYPSGVYVVKTESITCKIIKK